ncbi:type II secretion system F family protein [Sneathiella chinensis]|uniref:Type II secretion system protein GspF domain-containing protein n=1 Tax=Sneathiella chinensis TaxID=349750 RepID=A0ABQ5U016_9PROT|nr:type II secretion system F family protein [Sneathiella chinensis]GLQ05068.1 hypothetical protein GCM10007924_02890 [Sneathiella chinensis]
MQLLTDVQELIGAHLDIVLLVLVFVVVALIVFSLGSLFTGVDTIDKRIHGKTVHGGRSSDLGFSSQDHDKITQKLKIEEKGGLRHSLADAGFTAGYAPAVYNVSQIACAFLFGGGTYILLTIAAPELKLELILALCAGNALIGFMLPNVFLSRRKAARLVEVEHSFPDALDMLLVSMEAGASLDSALDRVGREIARAHPLLSEHLRAIGQELRAGTSREAAFRRFAQRIPTDDVRSFVALFVQTDRLGTSVAQALRVHAEEMRVKRVLRAEEKAHQLPVKLAIPLVLCILPALIAVIMTPAIIRIVRNFLF